MKAPFIGVSPSNNIMMPKQDHQSMAGIICDAQDHRSMAAIDWLAGWHRFRKQQDESLPIVGHQSMAAIG